MVVSRTAIATSATAKFVKSEDAEKKRVSRIAHTAMNMHVRNSKDSSKWSRMQKNIWMQSKVVFNAVLKAR
jgi:hypothetical protein